MPQQLEHWHHGIWKATGQHQRSFAAGGYCDVPGEGGGPQYAALLCPGLAGRRERPGCDGRGPSPGDKNARLPALLSGSGGRRYLDWRRGAAALEAPKRGYLPPDEFIPLAEQTGLILTLGDWVLETACQQMAAWAAGKNTAHLTVAVNISARQLLSPDFVQKVLTTLERTGANPKSLKLELTESMFVNDLEDVVAKMTELKSHGLRFALDDFGMGYSSLAYLRRLPLDQLKIDQEFVREILVDPSSAAIAQSIISLSKAMGLSVIAEGVETEGQREFLARLGCHSFQGFLVSGPVPLEDFELLLPALARSAAQSQR